MQPQPHIVTRGQYRVHPRGKVRQQPGQLSECFWRRQLVEILDNQRDAAASVGELRQHPVDHRWCIEVGCRGRQLRTTGRDRSVTDRVEQGQPELLGVALVAIDLQYGELARLPRTAGPGAQQRRLPAAGRRRDDRHLSRHRAIQGATRSPRSISRGTAGATVKGPPWYRRLTPLAPVTQSGHLLSRYQASARTVKPRRNPRFCRTLMRAPPPSRPALSRCGESPRESPGSSDGLLPDWRQA